VIEGLSLRAILLLLRAQNDREWRARNDNRNCAIIHQINYQFGLLRVEVVRNLLHGLC